MKNTREFFRNILFRVNEIEFLKISLCEEIIFHCTLLCLTKNVILYLTLETYSKQVYLNTFYFIYFNNFQFNFNILKI